MDACLNDEFNIFFATNGEDGLRVVRKEKPDVVLLDVVMPVMDGYEVCTRLKSDPETRDIPIIFVTAQHEVNDETRGLSIGAVDYISKPIVLAIVKARIKNQVMHKQAGELLRQSEAGIRKANDELQAQNKELAQLWEESGRAKAALKLLNDDLENLVTKRTAELREKDQILLLQSRQAAMGEMIGNIAHQWRQPLNTLGLTIQQLKLLYELGGLTKELLDQNVNGSMELIKHMSQTIDYFRNFFSAEKETTEFKIHEAIVNALSFLEGSFQNPKIDVEIVANDDLVIHGYANELTQVILNILVNAKDAITERGIADPNVRITIDSEDKCAVITITDNAGGIPAEIINQIFDPYFTTKGTQRGTGIGLFMSKAIIEKNMGGRLTVRNAENGAEFRIEL
jgi:C4-dicarboxylate-specific signal transduction histidine kinase